MKVIFVCTNYNSINCGIGMFTYNLAEELKKNKNLEIEILNTNMKNNLSLKSLFSIKVGKNIFKFINNNKKERKYYFIIEYPFMDWGIFTIFSLFYLKLKFRKSEFILSLHEYERVNILRKIIIQILFKLSDKFIFTDEKLIKKNRKPSLLRAIPSNISKENISVLRENKNYCYFGLINKSKAFKEMIDAWKIFNKSRIYNLNIYTASDLKLDDIKNYNINIFKGLSNREISTELQKNRYMILPIKPNIGLNNGTLKAAALHECIPIGTFDYNLDLIGININDENYSLNNFVNGLNKSLELDREFFSQKCNKFIKKFTFKKNAQEIYEFLKKNDS